MGISTFLLGLFLQPYFACLFAIITCTCYYYLKSEAKAQQKIIKIVFYLVFFIALFVFASSVVYRSYHPQIWDFTAFYLYGKVAASGHNFYLPENFHLVFNSMHLPFSSYEGFVAEVVNVGFPYPPPTMLYFAPLGFLSYNTALMIWTIFNLLFVFGGLYLICQLFFKESKLNGILLVSTLFFILVPSLSTVSSSQTNFILLFLLLLMKKYSDKKISGLFLALAFFTKPYMIIFGLFFLFRMKWKAIIYCAISALVLVGLTLIFFGKEPFISYIADNPLHRLPEYVFHESAYQSLYAVLLRGGLITPANPMTYIYIVAGIFLATACYLFYLLKRKLYDYMWAVLLFVALLVYPGVLFHYGVLLLFVIFQFFDEKKPLGSNPYITVPVIGIFYYLSIVSIFASICFLFLVIILKSLKRLPPVGLVPVKTLYKS